MTENIYGAVVVTYNPNSDRLRRNLISISGQCRYIIVVDNGSSDLETVKRVAEESNAECVSNVRNLGVSKALNQGFSILIRYGCSAVVTLDQDTICPDNMIDSFQKYLSDDVGIVCPAVHYAGKVYPKDDYRNGFEEIQACMTSACLVNTDAWHKVKGFNDDYFIDFVDNDFCMKLRLCGYRIIRDNSKYIEHELGSIREYHLGKRVIKKTYHSPIRYYYMTRNNLYFIKQYKDHIQPTKEYIRLLYVLGREIPYTGEILRSIRYAIRGYKDYKAGITGALEE